MEFAQLIRRLKIRADQQNQQGMYTFETLLREAVEQLGRLNSENIYLRAQCKSFNTEENI